MFWNQLGRLWEGHTSTMSIFEILEATIDLINEYGYWEVITASFLRRYELRYLVYIT